MTEVQQQIIANTINFVKSSLSGAEGGHDWWHILRVYRSAQRIADNEPGVNRFIVELSALLHDIADSKFHDGDELIGPKIASDFLSTQNVDSQLIDQIVKIIENISFKGGKETNSFTSPELAIVQDADRLDAIGAIGIARTFNYGGHKGREIYNPEILPDLTMSKEEYKKSTAPTINHFYEKLLLLKARMNTQTGRMLAAQRHAFMEAYLDQFYSEWSGEK